MSKANEKAGFYEARQMGGGMVMLFDRHESLSAAAAGMKVNREEGRIRHFVVQVIPVEDCEGELIVPSLCQKSLGADDLN